METQKETSRFTTQYRCGKMTEDDPVSWDIVHVKFAVNNIRIEKDKKATEALRQVPPCIKSSPYA